MATTHPVWDLLVIGGGTAGIVGATTAARLGARVALVERDRTGGDCLWTGCVPSKSLLASAGAAAHARRAHRLGVVAEPVTVDFAAVMRHVHGAIRTIEPVDSPATLEDAGVRVLAGDARFTSPGTVRLADGVDLRFRRALVATGARPTVPAGLRVADPWTSETLWEMRELPRRLVVVGGGTIGSELAQAFARLGSRVTLVEGAARILPHEDPDAAALVHTALQADGVDIRTGTQVTGASGSRLGGGQVRVAAADGEDDAVPHDALPYDALPYDALPYDALLVAVGRTPRTAGLGLDVAGIGLDGDAAVRVDRTLRTTNPAVWAAGDVTGHPRYTHVAGVHGSIAATNAVLGLRRTVDTAVVPRVTFTDPEVAAVGAATWGPDHPRTVTRRHDHVDRAVADADTAGFARLSIGPRHRVVGATVVGPRAGETIGELVIAVRHRLTTSDLTSAMHPYPTYDDGPWNAAIQDTLARLDAPVATALTRAVVLARRLVRARAVRAGARAT